MSLLCQISLVTHSNCGFRRVAQAAKRRPLCLQLPLRLQLRQYAPSSAKRVQEWLRLDDMIPPPSSNQVYIGFKCSEYEEFLTGQNLIANNYKCLKKQYRSYFYQNIKPTYAYDSILSIFFYFITLFLLFSWGFYPI